MHKNGHIILSIDIQEYHSLWKNHEGLSYGAAIQSCTLPNQTAVIKVHFCRISPFSGGTKYVYTSKGKGLNNKSDRIFS